MSTLTKPTPDHKQPTFIEIGPEDRVELSTAFGCHGRRSRRTIIIYKGQEKESPDIQLPTFIAIGVEDRVEVQTSSGDSGRKPDRRITIYPGQDKQPPICVTIQKERVVRG